MHGSFLLVCSKLTLTHESIHAQCKQLVFFFFILDTKTYNSPTCSERKKNVIMIWENLNHLLKVNQQRPILGGKHY
jgi:hypothetical protein